jgi:phospholipase/lecithinase/hemolysin
MMRAKFQFVLVFLLLFPLGSSASESFSQLYVFGDSLSDTGNAASVIGDFPPPFFMNRVSNGPVAVDILARGLGLSVEPSLHLIGIAVGTNYAVAGARANSIEPGDLDFQVQAFLANHGFMAPADALYVIIIGGNDIRDARSLVDEAEARTVVDAAAAAVSENLKNLIAAGAHKFLVANGPNIGIIPETRLIADAIGQPRLIKRSTRLTWRFNQQLKQRLKLIKAKTPRAININEFNLFKVFNRIIRKSERLGLTNTTDPCFLVDTFMLNPECNFDTFAFFDEIHPTARVHAIIGEAMLKDVTGQKHRHGVHD